MSAVSSTPENEEKSLTILVTGYGVRYSLLLQKKEEKEKKNNEMRGEKKLTTSFLSPL